LEDFEMKNVAFVVVALGMVACNSPRPNVVDSGPITLGDSGPRDSGPVGNDTGPVTGGCSLTVTDTSFPSLSAGCFPRCSSATATAVQACTTGQCVADALDADTTPGAAWTANGMAAAMPLDCGGCYNFQLLHCFAENGCRTETNAFLNCDDTTDADMCMGEVTAVNTCSGLAANMAGIMACVNDANMGVVACF
jgi:hypothetical protein